MDQNASAFRNSRHTIVEDLLAFNSFLLKNDITANLADLPSNVWSLLEIGVFIQCLHVDGIKHWGWIRGNPSFDDPCSLLMRELWIQEGLDV